VGELPEKSRFLQVRLALFGPGADHVWGLDELLTAA
jgi:hypothetical protein